MGRPITNEDIEMIKTMDINNVKYYSTIIIITGCLYYLYYF